MTANFNAAQESFLTIVTRSESYSAVTRNERIPDTASHILIPPTWPHPASEPTFKPAIGQTHTLTQSTNTLPTSQVTIRSITLLHELSTLENKGIGGDATLPREPMTPKSQSSIGSAILPHGPTTPKSQISTKGAIPPHESTKPENQGFTGSVTPPRKPPMPHSQGPAETTLLNESLSPDPLTGSAYLSSITITSITSQRDAGSSGLPDLAPPTSTT